MHQVTDGITQPFQLSASIRQVVSDSGSCDALTTQLSESLLLSSSLYAPNFPFSLLFVSKLTKSLYP